MVIGGFGDGVIRIYDADKRSKVVEIVAHARPVFAMDVASDSGLVSHTSDTVSASLEELYGPGFLLNIYEQMKH